MADATIDFVTRRLASRPPNKYCQHHKARYQNHEKSDPKLVDIARSHELVRKRAAPFARTAWARPLPTGDTQRASRTCRTENDRQRLRIRLSIRLGFRRQKFVYWRQCAQMPHDERSPSSELRAEVWVDYRKLILRNDAE